VFAARSPEGLHLISVVLNWQSETAILVLALKITSPVPACTLSSKEMTMAVLGGIIVLPVVGNVPVSVAVGASVPETVELVVLCKGPVLSVEETADPIFKVYTIPAVVSPGSDCVSFRELPAASTKALRSIVNL
jgi:hypothetical protein